jgi:hypothetical protein
MRDCIILYNLILIKLIIKKMIDRYNLILNVNILIFYVLYFMIVILIYLTYLIYQKNY